MANVDSFTIEDGQIYTNDQGVKQRIKFVPGTGVEFEVSPEYDTDSTKITVRAPGGGGGNNVPQSRTLTAVAPITGGGDLSVDRSFGFDQTADLDNNARIGVRKNSTGSTFERRRVNLVEGTGITLTVVDDSVDEEVDVTVAANGSGLVPTSRLLNTTSPITGGGDLSADRTLAFDQSAPLDNNARVGVRKNSTGSTFARRRVNLIEGTGITLTVADDSGNEEVDVTINSSGTGTVTGIGTTNVLTKFTNGVGGVIGDSNETDDGTTFTVGKRAAFPKGSPITLSGGDQNDLNIGDAVYVRFATSGGDQYINGITGGTNGRIIYLVNMGPDSVYVAHSNLTTASGTRFWVLPLPGFINNIGNGDGDGGIQLIAGVPTAFIYDSTFPTSAKWTALGWNGANALDTDGSGVNKHIATWSTARSITNSGIVLDSGGDKIVTYDTITTAGKGVVPIHDVVQLTGQTADIVMTPFGDSGSGLYRVSVYVNTSTRDSSAGLLSVSIQWGDLSGGSYTYTFPDTCDLTSTNGYMQGTFFLRDSGLLVGGKNYSTSTSGGGVATAVFDFYITIEKLSD